MFKKLLSVFVAVYRRGREERRETNKKWRIFILFAVYPVKTLRSQRSLRWAELLKYITGCFTFICPINFICHRCNDSLLLKDYRCSRLLY